MNNLPKHLEPALQKLRDYGFTVTTTGTTAKGSTSAPVFIDLDAGTQPKRYLAERYPSVTTATVDAIVAQLRHRAALSGHPALLLTDYLAPKVADALLRLEQAFVDTAGNANLKGPGFLIRAVGNKPEAMPDKARHGDLYTGTALKVLFALLCKPALAGQPQREIAAAGAVALGAVSGVLATLKDAGHLTNFAGQQRLNGTKRLLDEWVLGYAQRLHGKTLVATYTTDDFDKWREWDLRTHHLLWGGEPAAALLSDYLRPGILTIYADRLPPKFVVQQSLITKKNFLLSQRTLEIRKPFWGQDLLTEGQLNTVPPVLVYANLLATGDGRCIETSKVIYEKHLAGLYPEA